MSTHQPEHTRFASHAEEQIWQTLDEQLQDRDLIIGGLDLARRPRIS